MNSFLANSHVPVDTYFIRLQVKEVLTGVEKIASRLELVHFIFYLILILWPRATSELL